MLSNLLSITCSVQTPLLLSVSKMGENSTLVGQENKVGLFPDLSHLTTHLTSIETYDWNFDSWSGVLKTLFVVSHTLLVVENALN